MLLILSFITTLYAVTPFAIKTDCIPVDLSKKHTYSETVDGCFYSKSLQRNINYSVTFPKGYPEVAAPYSHVYFLHGRGGNHRQFREFCESCSTAKPATPCFSDEGPPALIISPSQTVHTYWKNSVDGKLLVEEMVTQDLIRHIERSEHVQKNPANRGIMGISMGGHGAIWMSLMHAGLFGKGAYAISPIFRSEKSLQKEDSVGFGSPSEFKKKDPLSLIKTQPHLLNSPFYIEIAMDDELYKKEQNTQEFFKFVLEQQPAKANSTHVGGHSLRYWCGALQRSMNFFKKNPTPAASSPVTGV